MPTTNSHDPPLPTYVDWATALEFGATPDATPQLLVAEQHCGGGARSWRILSHDETWQHGTVQGANTTRYQGFGTSKTYPEGYSARESPAIPFGPHPHEPNWPHLASACQTVRFQATADGGIWSIQSGDRTQWILNDGTATGRPVQLSLLDAHALASASLDPDMVLMFAVSQHPSRPLCWSWDLHPSVAYPCPFDDSPNDGRSPAWLLSYGNASLQMVHHALVDGDVRWHSATFDPDWLAPAMVEAMQAPPSGLRPQMDSVDLDVEAIRACVLPDAVWGYSPILYDRVENTTQSAWRLQWFGGGDAGMILDIDASTGQVVRGDCEGYRRPSSMP